MDVICAQSNIYIYIYVYIYIYIYTTSQCLQSSPSMCVSTHHEYSTASLLGEAWGRSTIKMPSYWQRNSHYMKKHVTMIEIQCQETRSLFWSAALVTNICVVGMCHNCSIMADLRFAPSQWEAALLFNDISHWLGENQESALLMLWLAGCST